MKNIELQQKSDEEIIYSCTRCNQKLDYDKLLNKFGPAGCYEIAKKLMEVADADMAQAIEDSKNNNILE